LTVILQKSVREGFGLTATEAMWKGTAVVAGRCGGLNHQLKDGVNGFLVSSIEEAAERIVQLIEDEKLRKELGTRAKETVQKRFLLPRKLEQYLDFSVPFEPRFAINHQRLVTLSLTAASEPQGRAESPRLYFTKKPAQESHVIA
jgi:trehalose synthase